MRWAKLSPDGSTVVNIFEAPEDWAGPGVPAGDDTARGDLVSGGGFVRPAPAEEAPTADALRARAKELRAAARASAAVTIGGALILIDTAPEDIAALTGLLVAAQSGIASPPFAFKGGGAFHDIDAAGLQAVAIAATAAVQRAYGAERAVLAGIAAAEITTTAALEAAFAEAMEG